MVHKHAFIEVTGDNSDVIILLLDQTQFIVQHAKQRLYVDGKKSIFLHVVIIFIITEKRRMETIF
jgi:hypothetical protein